MSSVPHSNWPGRNREEEGKITFALRKKEETEEDGRPSSSLSFLLLPFLLSNRMENEVPILLNWKDSKRREFPGKKLFLPFWILNAQQILAIPNRLETGEPETLELQL